MTTPTWVQDAIFYQIFPDRFAKSSRNPARDLEFESWDSPPTVHGFKGGDLYGIAEKLDYLKDLGVTALYLNPIFASASNHRYHAYDFYKIDPLLGGAEPLELVLEGEPFERLADRVLDLRLLPLRLEGEGFRRLLADLLLLALDRDLDRFDRLGRVLERGPQLADHRVHVRLLADELAGEAGAGGMRRQPGAGAGWHWCHGRPGSALGMLLHTPQIPAGENEKLAQPSVRAPDSCQLSAGEPARSRSCSRLRASRRDTCICEMPRRSAISDCVRPLKNLR